MSKTLNIKKIQILSNNSMQTVTIFSERPQDDRKNIVYSPGGQYFPATFLNFRTKYTNIIVHYDLEKYKQTRKRVC